MQQRQECIHPLLSHLCPAGNVLRRVCETCTCSYLRQLHLELSQRRLSRSLTRCQGCVRDPLVFLRTPSRVELASICKHAMQENKVNMKTGSGGPFASPVLVCVHCRGSKHAVPSGSRGLRSWTQPLAGHFEMLLHCRCCCGSSPCAELLKR